MSGASEKAYQEIRRRLLAGEFKPGSRLSEQELSNECNVSRTPVREALRRLASEYFVSIQLNRGAFVIDWSREDIADMFEMRAMLEGFAARKAAERVTPNQITKLKANIVKTAQIIEENSPDFMNEFLRLNRIFHDTVFEAAGSPRLTEIISRFVEQAVVVRTASQYTIEDLRRSNQYHTELMQAIAHHDGVLAETIMKGHILGAAGRYHDVFMRSEDLTKSVS
jgi:DNA-binding GntR family transcriptional regulator